MWKPPINQIRPVGFRQPALFNQKQNNKTVINAPENDSNNENQNSEFNLINNNSTNQLNKMSRLSELLSLTGWFNVLQNGLTKSNQTNRKGQSNNLNNDKLIMELNSNKLPETLIKNNGKIQQKLSNNNNSNKRITHNWTRVDKSFEMGNKKNIQSQFGMAGIVGQHYSHSKQNSLKRNAQQLITNNFGDKEYGEKLLLHKIGANLQPKQSQLNPILNPNYSGQMMAMPILHVDSSNNRLRKSRVLSNIKFLMKAINRFYRI